ncbi:hypothetical protein [Nostoc sp. ATCC 53789]|uniref:hypothetical protein n=1 Tax=Nostoc sp. ATCC 53789 TaxID=76335 RepID=UPI000DEC5840|nr:hypothetical protein [Nostoc sp. ATCC 53789]QHG21042.1 hypothetical protein GJB62_34880 [Nostoc sp. ATCC 53789]RCJ16812.1 hypothetical protein A6V25_30055 [Nostoc sp. ATCC 53789]
MVRRPRKAKEEIPPLEKEALVQEENNGSAALAEEIKVEETKDIEAEEAKDATAIERVPVEIVSEEEPLTDEERNRLYELENLVIESFYIAGRSLREINEKRLYRATHRTFEDYCYERFGFQRRHSYQLIEAATIADNLRERARPAHMIPTSEYQIRPLSRLKEEPEKQVAAWARSVEKAGGKAPTHDLVKETVAEYVEGTKENGREKVAYRLTKGDICVIKRNSDPRLSERVGYWGLIREVTKDVCTIELYDRTVADVDSNNLSFLKHTKREAQSRRKLFEQLSAIYQAQTEREEVVALNLEYFGRLRRPTLTLLEKSLLRFLEQKTKKGGKVPAAEEKQEG